MYIIVGLGNPGAEYEKTRHNMGFQVIDKLADKYNIDVTTSKHKGLIGKGVIDGQKVVLLKPQTYMNLSGEAVLGVCSFYKLAPKDIIVFHDDMDLAVGKVRVKRGGTPAGHNGLKSIDSHIGPDYLRVRIGIGHPERKSDVVNWVLGTFDAENAEIIGNVISKIAEHLPLLLAGDDQTFMNRLNQK